MDEYGERRGGFRGGRGRFGGSQNNSPKPVSVGDVIDVTIEATGAKGDGIAKKDGFVIFVKGASQGQTVKVKITSMGRSSASAEVVSGESAPAQPEPEAPAEETEEGDGEDLQQ
ncbi:MAG: TRAM domain-containing protein [Candidatus ainarchaeum sp.]|nr:TRAM domain-containing protein [Candidatus ainarchaeum sp.]